MNGTQRRTVNGWWIAVGVVAVMAIGLTAGAAVVVHALTHGAMVRVAVDDRGDDPSSVRVLVPTLAVDAALSLAPHFMPAEARADVRRQIGDFAPLLRGLARELERCPDATLVEVENADQHVTIRKRGDSLLVRVRSDDTDVDIDLPVHLAGHALRAFDV
jgi:hypothetical protein